MASGQKVGWAKLRVGVMALAALVSPGYFDLPDDRHQEPFFEEGDALHVHG